MKIVSLAIVIIFGGLLLVHYYRQYYNYTNLTKSTTWPCELDELGNCVKEIKLNKCPDYWQLSKNASESAAKCKNIYSICPANKPNCRSDKNYQDKPFTSADTATPQQKCFWSNTTKFSWDGACSRGAP